MPAAFSETRTAEAGPAADVGSKCTGLETTRGEEIGEDQLVDAAILKGSEGSALTLGKDPAYTPPI